MRIWSLHPKYLDAKGLVALWRESLLAKHVLEGKTKGYKFHPQLIRFRESEHPIFAINQYLSYIFEEAEKRKYQFDKTKIDWAFSAVSLTVTMGQISFEKEHLLKKLQQRDETKYQELIGEQYFVCHPLFKIIEGNIEKWEIVIPSKASHL
jgi:hypothetical protein